MRKKINFLVIAVLAASFSFMTSCKKDDVALTKPIIAVTEILVPQPTYYPGSVVKYTAAVSTSNGDLTTLKVTGTGATVSVTGTKPAGTLETDGFTFEKNTSSVTVSYDITIGAGLAPGSTIDLTFTVIDEKDETNSTTETITVVEEVNPITMETYTGKTLSYNSQSLTVNNMFNAADGSLLPANGTVVDMDFAFCWQNTYGYSIVSPDGAWLKALYDANSLGYVITDKNSTAIAPYSGTFASLSADDLSNLSVTSATVTGGGNGVQDLSEGDLLQFETEDGYKGVIQVGTQSKVVKGLIINVVVVAPAAQQNKIIN